jgi:hypothetical protein
MARKKDTITINKKIIPGIICLVPITAILISRYNPAVILLWIGVFIGIYMGKVSGE